MDDPRVMPVVIARLATKRLDPGDDFRGAWRLGVGIGSLSLFVGHCVYVCVPVRDRVCVCV